VQSTYEGGGDVSRIQGFGGKHEGKRPLGRTRRIWEDNVKIDLQEVGAWTGSSCLNIRTGGGNV